MHNHALNVTFLPSGFRRRKASHIRRACSMVLFKSIFGVYDVVLHRIHAKIMSCNSSFHSSNNTLPQEGMTSTLRCTAIRSIRHTIRNIIFLFVGLSARPRVGAARRGPAVLPPPTRSLDPGPVTNPHRLFPPFRPKSYGVSLQRYSHLLSCPSISQNWTS